MDLERDVDALILLAHGSRDPAWRVPFDRIAQKVRDERPGTHVVVAFMEYGVPRLSQAVDALTARGASRIGVAPLFLGLGGHVRSDLPRLVEATHAQYPHLQLRLTPSVGESEDVLDAIASWLAKLD